MLREQAEEKQPTEKPRRSQNRGYPSRPGTAEVKERDWQKKEEEVKGKKFQGKFKLYKTCEMGWLDLVKRATSDLSKSSLIEIMGGWKQF